MARTLIRITQGITRHPDYRMAQPVDFALTEGHPLAICGPNGGGKSLLVDMLTGAHPLLGDAIKYDFGGRNGNRAADNVRLVSFRDVYGAMSLLTISSDGTRQMSKFSPLLARCLCKRGRPGTLMSRK